MKNKWMRIIAWLFVCAGLVGLGADLSLRCVSSSEWLRGRAEHQLSVALAREVHVKKLSLSFLGLKLDGLEIAQPGGFSQGDFVSVGRLRVRWSLYHLLHGHLKLPLVAVTDVSADIVQDKFGHINGFAASPKEQTKTDPNSSSLPLNISVHRFLLQNVKLSFRREGAPERVTLSDGRFAVQDFGLNRAFSLTLRGALSYEKPADTFTVWADGRVKAHLAGLDFSQAFAEVENLSLQTKDSSVQVKARAHNFNAPQFSAQLTASPLSSNTLAFFVADVPSFMFPKARLSVDGHLQADRGQLAHLALSVPGVKVTAQGQYSWGKKTDYAAQLNLQTDVAQAVASFPQWQKQYQPTGTLTASVQADAQQASAKVSLQDGGVFVAAAGHFSQVKAKLNAEETKLWNTGHGTAEISGRFNRAPFEVTLSAAQTVQELFAKVNVFFKKLVVVAPKQLPAAETDFVPDARLEQKAPQSWNLPPVSVQAHVQVQELDVPYVDGSSIDFTADLTGLTPDLKQAQGTLALSMGKGEIKDLYHLTNANALTKVLFLSLNVVGKVFNSLNVFSVLDGIGGGVVSVVSGEDSSAGHNAGEVQTVLGPDGQPMEIRVPPSKRRVNGKMAYDKLETKVSFQDGVADVKNGSFVSDTMSFTVAGTTDFNTGKLDMTVQAAPGKHEADGIMPLQLKVGGTVEDPQGNMSLTGSVSSLVLQGIGNNVASRSVKKGLGGLWGLFKKKPTATAPEASQN